MPVKSGDDTLLVTCKSTFKRLAQIPDIVLQLSLSVFSLSCIFIILILFTLRGSCFFQITSSRQSALISQLTIISVLKDLGRGHWVTFLFCCPEGT